jgi:hypothetical protein
VPDAENVSANAEILVAFSEAILSDSVTGESVKLTDATGAVLTRTATLEQQALKIRLTQIPNLPTKLTLELKGLTDLAGNPLATTSWSWYVPASNYGRPVLLGEPSAVTDADLEERPLHLASDGASVAVIWLNSGNAFVKLWNGSAWQQLGDAFDFPQPLYAPQIKLLNGQPVVAFQEGRKRSETQTEPNGNILVYQWTGSEWQALEQVDTSVRDAAAPSLAVADDGTVTVAYFEFDGISSNVLVKRWDGSVWQLLGDALDIAPDRNAVFPALELDTASNPVVAWYEDRADNLSRNIYVKRWTGTNWEQLGASLNMSQEERADTFSIAIDQKNQPVVAFSEFDRVGRSNNVYVKRWNGVTWERLGNVADNIEAQRAIYPSVAVDMANQISVAWYEAVCQSVNPCNENDSVYLARWNGSAWEQFGPQDADARREAYFPSLAVKVSAPVLAWIEGQTGEYQIFVKRYRAE